MTENIVKRSGKSVKFNPEKIRVAITKASEEVKRSGSYDYLEKEEINMLTKMIISQTGKTTTVEKVQDIVEKELMAFGFFEVAKAYILYRKKHQDQRDSTSDLIERYKEIFSAADTDEKRENANINGDTPAAMMYRLGSTGAKIFANNYGLPEEFVTAEEEGYVHYHDADYTFITMNCFTMDLSKVFHGGFDNGHGFIREPNSIRSAGAIAAVAVQSCQNSQFGGVAISGLDFSLAEYVEKSWRKILKKKIDQCTYLVGQKILTNVDYEICKFCREEDLDYYTIREKSLIELERVTGARSLAEKIYLLSVEDLIEETDQAMEAFVHNLNSLHSRAGGQIPFSSVNFGMNTSPEGRLIIRSFLIAVWNGLGHGETAIFPISIFQIMPGINYNPEDPNYDLFQLAMKVSAKRLYPNFISVNSSFNRPYYKPDDYRTFASSMGLARL